MNDEFVTSALVGVSGHAAPFSDAELATVKSLDVDIARDLTGLERCTALETLRFFASYGETIDPLRNVKSLRTLKIGCVGISDLSPLVELPHLAELTINFTRVIDASPLFEMTSLQHAELIGNPLDAESYQRLTSSAASSPRFTLSPESHWRLTRKLFNAGLHVAYGNRPGAKPALVVTRQGFDFQADYVETSEATVERQLVVKKDEEPGMFLAGLALTEPTIMPIDYLLG